MPPPLVSAVLIEAAGFASAEMEANKARRARVGAKGSAASRAKGGKTT